MLSADGAIERVDSDSKLAPGTPYDVKMVKGRYRHPDTGGKLMKHIYTARDPNGNLLKWALVAYKWCQCKPYLFTPSKGRGPDYVEEKTLLPRPIPDEEYEE